MNNIHRELAINEMAETTELLEREKIELAHWAADSGGLVFESALQTIERACAATLPGYRAGEKLLAFRREIRDPMKSSIEAMVRAKEIGMPEFFTTSAARVMPGMIAELRCTAATRPAKGDTVRIINDAAGWEASARIKRENRAGNLLATILIIERRAE